MPRVSQVSHYGRPEYSAVRCLLFGANLTDVGILSYVCLLFPDGKNILARHKCRNRFNLEIPCHIFVWRNFCPTFLDETWLTDNVLDSHLVFNGYELHRADRRAPRKSRTTVRGGGVAILSSTNMKTERLDIKSTDPAVDSLWLKATHKGRSAVIGVLYRPPDSTMSRFIDCLRDQLLNVLAAGRPVFLLGDINIDISRPDARGVTAYKTLLNELSLHQLVQEPTHLSPTPTILDHIITNQPDIQSSVTVLSEALGDHQPVTCSVTLPKIRLKPEYRETRRWDRAD